MRGDARRIGPNCSCRDRSRWPRGNLVQILEGIKPGEKVVTDGSFFLRGEASRTRSSGG